MSNFENISTEELRRELERREASDDLFEILNSRAGSGVPSEVAEWIEKRLVDDGLFLDTGEEPERSLFLALWMHALTAQEALADEEALVTNSRIGERVIAAYLSLYAVEEELVAPARKPLPPVGSRVRFVHAVDRYPHFAVPAGSEGHVRFSDGEVYEVELDLYVRGAEDWSNGVVWSIRDGEDPAAALEVLS